MCPSFRLGCSHIYSAFFTVREKEYTAINAQTINYCGKFEDRDKEEALCEYAPQQHGRAVPNPAILDLVRPASYYATRAVKP